LHSALTWSYDGQGNLLTEATGGSTTSTYGYATAGNTVNELTSLAVSGQNTRYYSYDKYGNVVSIGPYSSDPCPNSSSTCLGYDALARLASVTEANNGPTIALTYNAMGLRAGYTVTPYGASQPSLNEQFTYRGGQLAQTVTISGTTYTDTYVYSQHGMPLELLRTTNGVLNRYWYERDGLGNVVALTDSSGTVVDQYAYDLWGKPTTVQESVPQPLRYQGYWYDTELGWYWLTSRAYDPGIKRFLQPDPSEMEGLFSYVYVGDDPVDGSDPSGFGGCWYKGLLPDGMCRPPRDMGPGGGDSGGVISLPGSLAGSAGPSAAEIGVCPEPDSVTAACGGGGGDLGGDPPGGCPVEGGGEDSEITTSLLPVPSWADANFENTRPTYDNPGTHDPKSRNYVRGKSVLPADAQTVYNKTSIPDPGNTTDGKTWYAINEQGNIYRYDGSTRNPNGSGWADAHWNGSVESPQGLQGVPNQVTRYFNQLMKNQTVWKELWSS